MAQQRPTTDRLASFSDAAFAVIITIMVLELKPPEDPTFAELRPFDNTTQEVQSLRHV